MGCQSSLLKQSPPIIDDPGYININFSQFIRTNSGDVFESYHFTHYISRTPQFFIRKGVHKKSGIQRTIKIIQKTQTNLSRIMRQIKTLKRLDHPNIVKMYEYYLDSNFVYIIFENLPGINLSDFLINHEKYDHVCFQSILKQILLATQHMHSNRVAHCNLIPENIILIEEGKRIHVKIVNFSSCYLDFYRQNPRNNEDLSIQQNNIVNIVSKRHLEKKYKSPEISTQLNIQKQDIWSIGVIFYDFLSLQKSSKSSKFLYYSSQLNSRLFSTGISNQLKGMVSLLKCMLDKNESNRFCALECLNHKYLKDFEKSYAWKTTIVIQNLHRFKAFEKLKSFIGMYITYKTLSIKSQSQFMIEFCNLDTNKDGKLQYNQLFQGLINTFSITQRQAQIYVNEIFQALDKNQNGCIQFSQFLMGTSNVGKAISQIQIMNIFKQIDQNNDGTLDQNEIRALLENFSNQKVNIMSKSQKSITSDQFKNIVYQLMGKT